MNLLSALGQQTLENWVLFLVCLAGGFLVGELLAWLINLWLKYYCQRNQTKLDDALAESLRNPITLLLGGIGALVGLRYLDLDLATLTQAYQGFRAFVILIGGYFTVSFISSLGRFYGQVWVRRTETGIDDILLPLIIKGLNLLVALLFILTALNTIGVDTTGFLAGMGIGGIALAMASKDSLSDLFGSLSVFADRPFQVGGLIVVTDGTEEYKGYVEEVTLRSTRLRTLDGTMVAIPNRKLAEATIENLSQAPRRRVVLEIELAPSIPADDIRKALQSIRSSLHENKHVPDGFRAHLTGVGEKGWKIEVNFVLDEKSYTRFNEIREHTLFEVQSGLEAAKTAGS